MSTAITYRTSSERLPALVASLVFLLPGVGAVIYGVLTWFGLTFMENTANGLLLGITGSIWTAVGVAIFRFRRWITVDPTSKTVVQGTRTLFRHPAERHALDGFQRVEVFDQAVGDGRFYVVALVWRPERVPRRFAHQPQLWLTTTEAVDEARTEAGKVCGATGLPLVDRTQGDRA